MSGDELELLTKRVEKLESEMKTTRKEDPGYEFARMCMGGKGKRIWWASEEFKTEERYQTELKEYNRSSWLWKLIFSPPVREDGSTITYNDMRSSNFYGWSK